MNSTKLSSDSHVFEDVFMYMYTHNDSDNVDAC